MLRALQHGTTTLRCLVPPVRAALVGYTGRSDNCFLNCAWRFITLCRTSLCGALRLPRNHRSQCCTASPSSYGFVIIHQHLSADRTAGHKSCPSVRAPASITITSNVVVRPSRVPLPPLQQMLYI
ncbi:hypothetical protein M3J09_002767 [Ascochyta lentis]